MRSPQAGEHGLTTAAVPPPWPAPQWAPPSTMPPPRRSSTGLAVAIATAIVLLVLAIAATIILLVANGDSHHTGIVTQPTVTAPVGVGE